MSFMTALHLSPFKDEMEEDFYRTLCDVKEAGFDGVEFDGLMDNDPAMISGFLKELELEPVSARVPAETLYNDPEGTAQTYNILGCRYLIVCGLDETPETTDLGKIREVSAFLRTEGIRLLCCGTDSLCDVLFERTDAEELQAQLDIGAILKAEAPTALAEKYADRAPLLTLNDSIDAYSLKNVDIPGAEWLVLKNDGTEDFSIQTAAEKLKAIKSIL